MKKLFISCALAIAVATVNAQTVNVSTYVGTDMTQYAGQMKDVKTNRLMFKGWNTVSLPFSMTEDQVNEAFGKDCRLEKLSSVSQEGSNIYMNFVNVKSEGIKADTPYILYYTRETGNVSISLQSVVLDNMPSEITFTTEQGVRVSMNGAQTQTDGNGLYGIRAIDNQEAKFVNVTPMATKFYATRCFVEVAGASGDVSLVTLHNAFNATASQATAKQQNLGTYNIYGMPVKKSANGFKIVNGKKTM